MKVAILIDGGYFLKRLGHVRPDIDTRSVDEVDKSISQLVYNHLQSINEIAGAAHPLSLLYRCFFYDAKPYLNKAHLPISKRAIDYSKTDEAVFRLGLFQKLRQHPSFAVRLGEVRRERAWVLNEEAQSDLLAKRRTVDDLTDADFTPGFRQKAVDMRIGVDIASITLKGQADVIVLVAGDSDFVPASKLARREGVRIILDPLWRQVEPSLFEHIDLLRSGFYKPKTKAAAGEAPAVAEGTS